MHGQPATITLRNDDEIMRALDDLGVTEGNRSAVIKAAILAAAATHRRDQQPAPEAALHQIREELSQIDRKLGMYLGLSA